MCFHKRFLFACSHYAWLTTPESVRPCEVERRFIRGATMIGCKGCTQMWSHGFYTIRVGGDCQGCVSKRRRTESTIGEVREVIRALRTNLGRMTTSREACHDRNKKNEGLDDEEEGEEGEEGREHDWRLMVRSKNSDLTRTLGGTTGLDLTSSPGWSSKTDTRDTSLSLDYEDGKDHGLVREHLPGEDGDDEESENERMEEVSFVSDTQQRTSLCSQVVTAAGV
ncbi:hypothetical protein QBC36DRAFT_175818 [Triangularia setosa]|uniref:Uncharacterized protein n=1 Tax=Triangularia setosa TaxID=2587417 RepID=A0AAN7AC87_9PEZI|nr:hypothetical protein QBC36DRAFT_175818 [Podospora setosa]